MEGTACLEGEKELQGVSQKSKGKRHNGKGDHKFTLEVRPGSMRKEKKSERATQANLQESTTKCREFGLCWE